MESLCKINAKTQSDKNVNSISQSRNNDCCRSANSPAEKIMFLQRTAGNQAVQSFIKSRALQAKLKIGQPNDIYEQEADRVAEQVMRMPEPGVQRQPIEEEEKEQIQTKPIIEQITPLVQRQTEEEEEQIQTKSVTEQTTPLVQRQIEDEEEELQAKTTSGLIPEVQPNVESHIHSLKGGGQPLSKNDHTFFEPRFGHDFSKVRVHTDSKAAESARAVNAQAFTVGRNVVFGVGEYVPGTSEGRRLLAHELTHAVHQHRHHYYSKNYNTSRYSQRAPYSNKENQSAWIANDRISRTEQAIMLGTEGTNSAQGTVESLLACGSTQRSQQKKHNSAPEMKYEPAWLTSKIDKSNFKKKDCNFPFKIFVTGIPCSCHNLKWEQRKKGLFTFIYDGNRKCVPPASQQAGTDWTDDKISIFEGRGQKMLSPSGPKEVIPYAKILPMACYPPNIFGLVYVTYVLLDTPGFSWNFGHSYQCGNKKRKITGIEWNVMFQHNLFCGREKVWSTTFTLTGKHTRKQDTRKIIINNKG